MSDDLGPCYCGDPRCVKFRHVARMARHQNIANGNGDPLVAFGHLFAIAASLVVLWVLPPPLWIGAPFMLAFWLRFHLLYRQAHGKGR